MTQREYNRLTFAEMKQRRWRTAYMVITGQLKIPAGVEVKIVGKAGGLGIEGPPCKCCGVAVYARKVRPGNVEEVV